MYLGQLDKKKYKIQYKLVHLPKRQCYRAAILNYSKTWDFEGERELKNIRM